MSSKTIRFATEDIRDLSDGEVPVEIWVVREDSGGNITERHSGTATKKHTIERHVKKAARGLPLFGSKHVEIRTPKSRDR